MVQVFSTEIHIATLVVGCVAVVLSVVGAALSDPSDPSSACDFEIFSVSLKWEVVTAALVPPFVFAALFPILRGLLALAFGMTTWTIWIIVLRIRLMNDGYSDLCTIKPDDTKVAGYVFLLVGMLLSWFQAVHILVGPVAERFKAIGEGAVRHLLALLLIVLQILGGILFIYVWTDASTETSFKFPVVLQNGFHAFLAGIALFVAHFGQSKYALWVAIFANSIFQFFFVEEWFADREGLDEDLNVVAGVLSAVASWAMILFLIYRMEGSSLSQMIPNFNAAPFKFAFTAVIVVCLGLVIAGGSLVGETHLAASEEKPTVWWTLTAAFAVVFLLLSFVQTKDKQQGLALVAFGLLLSAAGRFVEGAFNFDKHVGNIPAFDDDDVMIGAILVCVGLFLAFVTHGAISYKTFEKLTDAESYKKVSTIVGIVGFAINLVGLALWWARIDKADSKTKDGVEIFTSFISLNISALLTALYVFRAIVIQPENSALIAFTFWIGFFSPQILAVGLFAEEHKEQFGGSDIELQLAGMAMVWCALIIQAVGMVYIQSTLDKKDLARQQSPAE